MYSQVTEQNEGLSTLITAELFESSVEQLVCFQGALLSEGPPTLIAAVRFHAAVDQLV